MNSSSVTSSTYLLGTTSATIPPQPLSEGSVPFGPAYSLFHVWRKFLRASRQPRSESVMKVVIIPLERTITEGSTVLKPAPLPEDYDAKVESFRRFLNSLESEAETAGDATTEQ